MSAERLLWAIGDPDATSAELVDNYREPRQVAPPVWRVGAAEAQRWPVFHPSEADPAGGYRRQPYMIIFELGDAPEAAYLLRLHYLIIAPRYGYVAVTVNGVTGRLYLRPAPALGTEIRVPAALHTSLYADGVAELAIPGGLLQQGENCIALVACDEEPVTQFDNPEKIARLDRMATGAGFVYRALQLWATAAGDGTLRRVDVVPTVLYRADKAGALWETCYLHAELNGPLPAGRWQLALAG
ncbi:MAG: polysaccharide lyase family protein, partial [Anaerolineae bacterium]|nr:polysaccharide lyase family protein [Anaerolineae bacterium]